MEIYKFKVGDKCRIRKLDEIANLFVRNYFFGISKEALKEYEGKEYTILERYYNKAADVISYKLAEEDPLYGFIWHQDMLEKIKEEN